MKIIKLNRRYRIFNQQGFELGLRFDHWDREASAYEKAAQRALGDAGWLWRHTTQLIREDWCSGFGQKRPGQLYTPYWVYLRREEMLSFVMLAVDRDYV